MILLYLVDALLPFDDVNTLYAIHLIDALHPVGALLLVKALHFDDALHLVEALVEALHLENYLKVTTGQ